MNRYNVLKSDHANIPETTAESNKVVLGPLSSKPLSAFVGEWLLPVLPLVLVLGVFVAAPFLQSHFQDEAGKVLRANGRAPGSERDNANAAPSLLKLQLLWVAQVTTRIANTIVDGVAFVIAVGILLYRADQFQKRGDGLEVLLAIAVVILLVIVVSQQQRLEQLTQRQGSPRRRT